MVELDTSLSLMWPLGGARLLSPAEGGRRTAGLVRGMSFPVFSREGPLSPRTGITRPGPAQVQMAGAAASLRPSLLGVLLTAPQWKDPQREAGLARIQSQFIIASHCGGRPWLTPLLYST